MSDNPTVERKKTNLKKSRYLPELSLRGIFVVSVVVGYTALFGGVSGVFNFSGAADRVKDIFFNSSTLISKTVERQEKESSPVPLGL